jgi:hypothetical protein
MEFVRLLVTGKWGKLFLAPCYSSRKRDTMERRRMDGGTTAIEASPFLPAVIIPLHPFWPISALVPREEGYPYQHSCEQNGYTT